ncbi:hypothetical protein MAJ_11478, partial [Metarhizium majus ARSEF 297]
MDCSAAQHNWRPSDASMAQFHVLGRRRPSMAGKYQAATRCSGRCSIQHTIRLTGCQPRAPAPPPFKAVPPEDIIFAAHVHGALIELEKWVPTAGLAMVQVFFPQGLAYNDAAIRDNVHKRFWKRAYGTRTTRTRAEKLRRSLEQQATAPARDPAPC